MSSVSDPIPTIVPHNSRNRERAQLSLAVSRHPHGAQVKNLRHGFIVDVAARACETPVFVPGFGGLGKLF